MKHKMLSSSMNIKQRVVVIKEMDNVATALSTIKAGTKIVCKGEEVIVLEDISFGHKIALDDIEKGQHVVKYGQEIGLASFQIRRGEHVHVHNVRSQRSQKENSKDVAGTSIQ